MGYFTLPPKETDLTVTFSMAPLQSDVNFEWSYFLVHEKRLWSFQNNSTFHFSQMRHVYFWELPNAHETKSPLKSWWIINHYFQECSCALICVKLIRFLANIFPNEKLRRSIGHILWVLQVWDTHFTLWHRVSNK